jgi:hypothetical protein
VIVRRRQEWTRKAAKRQTDGIAFDEMAAGSNFGLDAPENREDGNAG